MKTKSLIFALLSLTCCATKTSWIPLSASKPSDIELTLVWVGRGECEIFENGRWVRREELDYDFSVEQRRMGTHWESVKSLRRLHPAYDGSAGARTQTMFFRLDFAPVGPAQRVEATLTSSLGEGTGVTDRAFRKAELQFTAAGVSPMAPFDRYRITQAYDYEEGRLTEMVELNKGEKAWVRNREVATLFAAHRFETAPTTAREARREGEPKSSGDALQ